MRQRSVRGLILPSAGVLALIIAGACGHRDIITASGSGATGNETSVGGSTSPAQGGSGNVGGGTGATCNVEYPKEKTRPFYTEPRKPEVNTLLSQMPLSDKILQMQGLPNPATRDSSVYRDIERSQDTGIIPGTGKSVLGYRYRDAGRGLNLAAGQDNRLSQNKDYATVFPTQSARAASWDVDLEYRIGEAIGEETMTSKNNMLLAPCMNIIRHPYWGRTQETYSEDMHHTGRMASAMTAGIQQRIVACPKHYAANNVENNRDNQNAEMNEQTLREIYVKHFDMVVREGGAGCIMASYNLVNGTKATQNKHLLYDLLKAPLAQNGMGYRGFVLTDWWAMPGAQTAPDTAKGQTQAKEAVEAGLDVEVPWNLHYNHLGALVASGAISEKQIDDSAGRVLEQKARFESLYKEDNKWGKGTSRTQLVGDSIEGNEIHLALAEEAAVKSAVLLRNGGTGVTPPLPIKGVTTIAVVGLDQPVRVSGSTEPPPSGSTLHHATDVNLGDRGSSRVNNDPLKSIGPCRGLQDAGTPKGITVTCGNSIEASGAANADFVVVVAGLTAGDEGEEYSIQSRGDRKSLNLPEWTANGVAVSHNAFIDSVLALDKPTAIILHAGSIVNLPWLGHANQKQATIWAGYGGQRQGAAYAKLLFGDANFSGKMPMAWPKQEDLPPFTTGATTTVMGYFFGYREYDRRNAESPGSTQLVFPFGHGLSYSTFRYDKIELSKTSTSKCDLIDAKVTVTNTSAIEGEEIVMLFVKGPPKPQGITGDRPVKALKGFAKVNLKPTGTEGSTATVSIPLKIEDLRHWEGGTNGKWVIDSGTYTLLAGPSGDDAALTQMATLTVN